METICSVLPIQSNRLIATVYLHTSLKITRYLESCRAPFLNNKRVPRNVESGVMTQNLSASELIRLVDWGQTTSESPSKSTALNRRFSAFSARSIISSVNDWGGFP